MRPSNQSSNGSREDDRQAIDLFMADPRDMAGKRAVSALLSRYADRVYALCLRYAGDHDRAMDLSQESLLQAYRKLHTLSDAASFLPWLFAITRNRCLSELRKTDLLMDCGLEPDDLVSSMPDPAKSYEEAADLSALQEVIRLNLDPREQEAVYLRCFERMSVDAITSILGITESSGARGLLQRARRKLRAALDSAETEKGRNA